MVLTVATLASCTRPSVPTNCNRQDRAPRIMPDYTDVTIPANLCPTNFIVTETGNEAVVRISAGTQAYTYGGDGMKVMIDEEEWTELTAAARGGALTVETYVKEGSQWTAYQPFHIYVAADSIDPYISYRLIPPSYVAYNHLRLAERNLTTFDETIFYDNRQADTSREGQCVNCHSYQNYHTDHMLFHLRHAGAGTIIVDGNDIKKVNLKTDSTISAGVYPAWHPTLPLIAFSTDLTGQTFHTKSQAKIEVQDTESDLILYDVEHNEVTYISALPDELEVFPTWSADGRTLYYCSAHFHATADSTREEELITNYQDIRYNLYSRTFDPATHQFGPPILLYDAAADGMSATLPRTSPDGHYLVFALAPWGCFHVWHPEADIYIMDLHTHDIQPLTALNSDRSESYPTFSSNGRWVMTASRRDDGNYTRPYIAYFDSEDRCHKPFELPQRDPAFYILSLCSYNRPEFMAEPIRHTSQQFAAQSAQAPIRALYQGKESNDSTQTNSESTQTFSRLSATS